MTAGASVYGALRKLPRGLRREDGAFWRWANAGEIGDAQMQDVRNSAMRIVCAGLVFLVNVILPAIALAQKAPDKPTIAVSADPREGGTIWLIDPDGADQRAILDIVGNPLPLGLAWSPDGRKLAFHTEVNGNVDIYVMNADGRNLKQLTEAPAEDSWPQWHPSNQRIIFTSDRDGNFEIYVMTAEGEGIENLTNDPVIDIDPAWSPDGRNIVFSSKRGKTLGDLFVMDANGEDLRNLTNHRALDTQPKWSPDGSQILWTSHRDGTGDIFLMNADGGNAAKLNAFAAPRDHWEELEPTWSPDGEMVAYVTAGGGDSFIILAIAGADEAEQGRLQIGARTRSPAWFDPDFIGAFAVSPAAKRILTWSWLKRAVHGN